MTKIVQFYGGHHCLLNFNRTPENTGNNGGHTINF